LERDGKLPDSGPAVSAMAQAVRAALLGHPCQGTTAFPTVKPVAESSAPTRLVLPVAIQSWSLTSLQQRLFRTGGRLIRHARYFTLQLAESYLTGTLFRQILQRIERLAWHQT